MARQLGMTVGREVADARDGHIADLQAEIEMLTSDNARLAECLSDIVGDSCSSHTESTAGCSTCVGVELLKEVGQRQEQ